MKQVFVAVGATVLLALAGAAQALPLKETAATGRSFASTEVSSEVSSNQQPSLRQSAPSVSTDSDGDSAPINPYALAAAGLMAVAFLARHRPMRD